MGSITLLPDSLRQAVTAEFAGQPVVWTGRPQAARIFWPAMMIWLFAVPWTAFALFWEAMAVGPMLFPSPRTPKAPDGMMPLFALFGLPFVLVGFAMLAGPFWLAIRARRTVYALSAQRLATIVVGRSLDVESVSVGDIGEMARRERQDRSGDLMLTVGWTRDSDGDRVARQHKLVGVPEVRRVEDILRALRDTRRQR